MFKWVVVSIYHIVKVSYRLIAIFLKSLVDSVQFLEKLVFLESFKAIFFQLHCAVSPTSFLLLIDSW